MPAEFVVFDSHRCAADKFDGFHTHVGAGIVEKSAGCVKDLSLLRLQEGIGKPYRHAVAYPGEVILRRRSRRLRGEAARQQDQLSGQKNARDTVE